MSSDINLYTIARATSVDLVDILHFRSLLFQEMEIPATALQPNARELLQERYRLELSADRLVHYVARSETSEIVATVGILLKDDFPYYFFQPGFYGWVVDVYTLPQHRGRGLSQRLLEPCLQWLKSKGGTEARLIASGSAAKRLYSRAGFLPTWEMYLPLEQAGTYNDFLYEREKRHAAQH